MKKFIAIICMGVILVSMTSPAYAAKKDTKAPTITKTNPIDMGTDIMIESNIVIRFSEAIKKSKAIDKITLKGPSSKSTAFTYEIKDNLLIITPKADIKYKSEYTVSIAASAIKDVAGNNLKKAYTFRFLTEEDPAKKTAAKEVGTKYNFEIEAVLNGKFTKDMQTYLVQYLKLFGINANVKNVEEITDESETEATPKKDTSGAE